MPKEGRKMIGRKIVSRAGNIFGSLDGAVSAFRRIGGRGADALGMMILGAKNSQQSDFQVFDLWSVSVGEFFDQPTSFPEFLEVAKAHGFEGLTLEEALTGAIMCSRLERDRWRCACYLNVFSRICLPVILIEHGGSLSLSGETCIRDDDHWLRERSFVLKRHVQI